MSIDEVKTSSVDREHMVSDEGKPVKKGWAATIKDNPGLYIATLIAFLMFTIVFSCVLIYALTIIFDPAL